MAPTGERLKSHRIGGTSVAVPVPAQPTEVVDAFESISVGATSPQHITDACHEDSIESVTTIAQRLATSAEPFTTNASGVKT